MEESSQNKNRMNNNDEIYLNDVVMEEERMEEKYEIQPSLQTEENIDANGRKEKLKEIFKK
jgi:LEA14-like dessication related protein